LIVLALLRIHFLKGFKMNTTITANDSSARPVLRLLLLLLALPAMLGMSALVSTTASADVAGFVGAVNQERSARGLAPLTTQNDLNAVAQAWSQQMASSKKLAHNPSLGSQVTAWRSVGENVGYGSSEASIHRAFMASPGHAANVLNGSYNQIGIGITVSGGTTWVTQVFRQSNQPTITGWQKTAYNPTIYALSGSTHRPASFSEWAGAGYPNPTPTNTWYVRYPWSSSVYAVTFWAQGWQWDRLSYGEWIAAQAPTPRLAGWIDGSSLWKYAASSTLYLTDPEGNTHPLNWDEWEDTGFRAPTVR
jgi:uncharacterized protein YkwD